MGAESGHRKRAARSGRPSFAQASPGRLLHDAHVRMSAGLVQTLRGEGYRLTTEGWALLSLLSESDELPQLEISERVGKDRHHTSRLIDALEQQGLVVRKPTASDGRVKLVALTEKGRDTRRALLRVVSAFVDGVFEGVPPSDFEAFIRVLSHVAGRLPARGQRDDACPDAPAAPKRRSRRSDP